MFSFPFVVVKNPPRVQFYAYSAETHKYGRCFLYSFVNVASSFAERAIGCIARAVSVPERVARVRSYLRVGRRPTDFVALLCVIKINLLENGFYGGRRVREEGSRCHFERLLYIEEYFVNAHRTSVASRYLREGRVFPRGDLTFFCAKPCVLRKPVRSRPRDFFPSSPLSPRRFTVDIIR